MTTDELFDKPDFTLSKMVVKLLAIFSCFMLVISLFKGLNGNINSNSLTFASFLEYLSNAPIVKPSFSISDFTIVGDWGLFDFLKNFLNFFTPIFGFTVLLSSFFINVLNYCLYFLSFLFV